MRREVHSEAREEFLQAVSFYEAQVQGLGLRFIAEMERRQKALLQTPRIGRPFGRRLRKFAVGDRFPYSIVYAVVADVIFVLAYADGLAAPRLLADTIRSLEIDVKSMIETKRLRRIRASIQLLDAISVGRGLKNA
jgi:hypothetical protein